MGGWRLSTRFIQFLRGGRMKLRTLLLLFSFCAVASAQTPLQSGTPIDRDLEGANVHEFTVNLEENDFIQLVVEQRGIDVVVKVFSPAGKDLGEFDSPTGSEGPEHVSFVAITAGSYRVTVGPLDPNDRAKGRYQIKILEVRQATEQELKTSKNLEVTKAKGVALLGEIEALIPQIKSPQTRIKAQLEAAKIVWDIDEKRGSRLFADATTGFKEFLATIDVDYFFFSDGTVAQLRHEIVQALAERDPDAALSFLHATGPMMAAAFDRRQHTTQEAALELSIAEQVMRSNPKRALQMAKESLKRGYSSYLVATLSQLQRQHPELAAELANEIAAKLLNDKLLKLPETGHMAASLLRFGSPSKELVQKIFDEVMSYSRPTGQGYDAARDSAWLMLTALKSFGQLDTFISGGSAAVEKKLTELANAPIPYGTSAINVFGGNPADFSKQDVAKLPPEMREQYYIQLAYNQANSGDLTRARETINERMTNPTMRRHVQSQIDQIEVQQGLNKGKVEEVLKFLSGIRNTRERAQQLTAIANRIGPGLKRSMMLSFLEQARSLLSPSVQAQDQDQMFALFEMSRAFSRYDVKRSFEIIEPLIEQFNELTVAARTLDGFSQKYYEGDELDLNNSSPLAVLTVQMSSVLGNLAMINFERAKATTDRLRAPEVRLKIYLDMAQQTIKAAK